MRLNSYLAKGGVASRRGADKLIKTGKVMVNGRSGQLNDDVSEGDSVLVDGKQIKLRKSRYILLHKPVGYITTLKDPRHRAKVTDLVKVSERVVPVGRLDKDTTGVLLLTNDGALAHRLMHPTFMIDKVYEAVVRGSITIEKLKMLSGGINIDEGKTAPAKARILQGRSLQKGCSLIELTVHEGRKHQVKRMLAAVGLETLKLHRRQYGPLTLDGLAPGQWRDLTEKELKLLK